MKARRDPVHSKLQEKKRQGQSQLPAFSGVSFAGVPLLRYAQVDAGVRCSIICGQVPKVVFSSELIFYRMTNGIESQKRRK
jgi:hypothetical protein